MSINVSTKRDTIICYLNEQSESYVGVFRQAKV